MSGPTRFTLVVAAGGRAILTSHERLSAEQILQLRDAISGWAIGKPPLLVIPDCDVVRVETIDINLDAFTTAEAVR